MKLVFSTLSLTDVTYPDNLLPLVGYGCQAQHVSCAPSRRVPSLHAHDTVRQTQPILAHPEHSTVGHVETDELWASMLDFLIWMVTINIIIHKLFYQKYVCSLSLSSV